MRRQIMLRKVVTEGTASFGEVPGYHVGGQDRHGGQAEGARRRLLRRQGDRDLRHDVSRDRPALRADRDAGRAGRDDRPRAAPHGGMDRGAGDGRDDRTRRAASRAAAGFRTRRVSSSRAMTRVTRRRRALRNVRRPRAVSMRRPSEASPHLISEAKTSRGETHEPGAARERYDKVTDGAWPDRPGRARGAGHGACRRLPRGSGTASSSPRLPGTRVHGAEFIDYALSMGAARDPDRCRGRPDRVGGPRGSRCRPGRRRPIPARPWP